jgi:delta(3,5)-delta(2,4)-dienoyl-CoA isomerase
MSPFLSHPILSKNFSHLKIEIVTCGDDDGYESSHHHQQQEQEQKEPSPHIVVVTLNRIRKRNAINRIMWREIGEIFSILGRIGDDCRAVILTGAGTKAFTSGIDISDPELMMVSSDDPNDDVARKGMAFLPKVLDMQRCFTAIEECPVPVIAVIQGSCIGAGIDIASVCDIRLCTRTAQFSVREVKIGLAADVGTLQRFPKITGNDSRVRELCLTGEMFTAQEALRIGFVSRICSNSDTIMEDAVKLAKVIAANSPVAVMGTKRSLVYSRDHSVSEGLNHIATHNACAIMSDDIPTAMISSKQKKTARFSRIPKLSKL